jgi:hypothetical protein
VAADDAALEVDRARSFVRDAPYNQHDTGSVKMDNLQGADRTDPIVNADDDDGAPLSITESSGQILAPKTVSALSSPDVGKDSPMMVGISNFTTAKILDKRSSPFGIEYRGELMPLWLPADLVEKVQVGRVRIQSYENEIV